MTATATLYAMSEVLAILNAQIELRADEIAANGGALPDDMAALLDDADGSFDAKTESVVCYMRDVLLDAEKAKKESDRLAARAKAYEARHTALKNYLKISMERAGKVRVERPLATVTIQQSSPSVQSSLGPDQLALLREAYPDLINVTPETYSLDKKACAAAFAAKRALPNGVTVQRGTHVVIR